MPRRRKQKNTLTLTTHDLVALCGPFAAPANCSVNIDKFPANSRGHAPSLATLYGPLGTAGCTHLDPLECSRQEMISDVERLLSAFARGQSVASITVDPSWYEDEVVEDWPESDSEADEEDSNSDSVPPELDDPSDTDSLQSKLDSPLLGEAELPVTLEMESGKDEIAPARDFTTDLTLLPQLPFPDLTLSHLPHTLFNSLETVFESPHSGPVLAEDARELSSG